MADPNKPQSWIIQVCLEDIYHTHVIVSSGTLREVLTKAKKLSDTSGAVCKIFSFEQELLSPNAAWIYKELSDAGMLLKQVAHVNRDYEFLSWRGAFARVFEKLPYEQRQTELENLRQRLDKEIAALTLLVNRHLEGQDAVLRKESEAQPTPAETPKGE